MNIVDQLLKIDLGEIEVPKTLKKMYCKKIKQTLEFDCVAVDPEKANSISAKAMGMEKGEITEVKMFDLKVFTLMEGCKIFKNNEVLKHFKSPTPVELIKTLLTDGEISELYNTITDLSAYKEAGEDEIKN